MCSHHSCPALICSFSARSAVAKTDTGKHLSDWYMRPTQTELELPTPFRIWGYTGGFFFCCANEEREDRLLLTPYFSVCSLSKNWPGRHALGRISWWTPPSTRNTSSNGFHPWLKCCRAADSCVVEHACFTWYGCPERYVVRSGACWSLIIIGWDTTLTRITERATYFNRLASHDAHCLRHWIY